MNVKFTEYPENVEKYCCCPWVALCVVRWCDVYCPALGDEVIGRFGLVSCFFCGERSELLVVVVAIVELSVEAASNFTARLSSRGIIGVLMCRWLMCACKSRCERYVRRHPLLSYRVPPCVHMKTVPRPVCSTRIAFSLHRGHIFIVSLRAQPKQKTCLHGIMRP